jgi:hypothetical protein
LHGALIPLAKVVLRCYQTDIVRIVALDRTHIFIWSRILIMLIGETDVAFIVDITVVQTYAGICAHGTIIATVFPAGATISFWWTRIIVSPTGIWPLPVLISLLATVANIVTCRRFWSAIGIFCTPIRHIGLLARMSNVRARIPRAIAQVAGVLRAGGICQSRTGTIVNVVGTVRTAITQVGLVRAAVPVTAAGIHGLARALIRAIVCAGVVLKARYSRAHIRVARVIAALAIVGGGIDSARRAHIPYAFVTVARAEIVDRFQTALTRRALCLRTRRPQQGEVDQGQPGRPGLGQEAAAVHGHVDLAAGGVFFRGRFSRRGQEFLLPFLVTIRILCHFIPPQWWDGVTMSSCHGVIANGDRNGTASVPSPSP